EVFDEEVTLPAGVTVYGGLECEDDWKWQAAVKTTVAPTAGGAVPLGPPGSNQDTALPIGEEDVAFLAPDATEPGQSSIAAQARLGKATLRRCLFQAGMAAHGEAGADAPSTPPPAPPQGNNGAPGYCSDLTNTAPAGGAATANPNCNSTGGKG